jgi:hypothetical protein
MIGAWQPVDEPTVSPDDVEQSAIIDLTDRPIRMVLHHHLAKRGSDLRRGRIRSESQEFIRVSVAHVTP